MVDAKKASQTMHAMMDNVTSERDLEGKSVGHIKWMLEQIISGELDKPDNNEKAHRWLGYAQGLFVAEGITTMDDLREINVNAKEKS